MPIKIPRGFQRRKSSGNVLDEVPNTEPSFKVFARPASSGQMLDSATRERGIRPLPARKNSFPAARNSFEQEDEDLFTVMRPTAGNRYYSQPSLLGPGPDGSSGSGGTDNSLSVTHYDSAASSTRLSTSSTNPSSIDTRSDKHIQSSTPRAQSDAPAPPPHQSKTGGFLRNAGRTFSFGMKSQKGEIRESEDSAPPPLPTAKPRFSLSGGRERATTTSSVSTATPPRLLDSELSLNTNELDGLGNIFDGIGKSREPSPARPSPASQKFPAVNSASLRPDAMRNLPGRPPNVDRFDHVVSSPYSYSSDTSRDGLMRSPSPPKTATQNSPQIGSIRPFAAAPGNSYTEHQLEDNLFSETPSRARAYSRPTRQPGPPPTSFNNAGRLASTQPPTSVSLIAERPGEQEESGLDTSLLDSAALATKYEETKPTGPVKKVMTPQQFERYRQQQDERHRMNRAFGKTDSDDSGDDYDDGEDDDMERDRQAVKQRKKQEAHLAVYRQTMIKVTGEPAPVIAPPSNGVGHNITASTSSQDLSNRLSTFNFETGAKSATGKSSDEDEDEDVPLGILAAHGFPNKNRPPARLMHSGSNSNLRGPSQPHGGASSVAGEPINRMSLPAFARKLPEDPYYGASLVNQPQRESLAFHSTPNLNTLAVPSGAATNHPHHPAGLIGVIAGEERARAARRGSPNPTSGQYDLPPSMSGAQPGMLRSQTMGHLPAAAMAPGMPMMPGMLGMPGMPTMMPQMSPGDQAQIQMSQQMTHMMQMQMQWMQQMQNFMTGSGQPAGGMVPGPMPGMMPGMMPAMPQNDISNMPRPQSVPLQSYGGPAQRSMSTLEPGMANWNLQLPTFNDRPGSAYAASIAPSERSNVGLASRYRPVSIAPEPSREPSWQKRASTMTSSTFRPMSTMVTPKPQPASTVRKVAAAADDDDDEAGWAEMKAKKEKKQRSWKLRKGNNPLQELYNGTG